MNQDLDKALFKLFNSPAFDKLMNGELDSIHSDASQRVMATTIDGGHVCVDDKGEYYQECLQSLRNTFKVLSTSEEFKTFLKVLQGTQEVAVCFWDDAYVIGLYANPATYSDQWFVTNQSALHRAGKLDDNGLLPHLDLRDLPQMSFLAMKARVPA